MVMTKKLSICGDGKLRELLGKKVTFFCVNYIYTGILIHVNESCASLKDAAIVYETGSFADTKWRDAQPLPGDWHVRLGAVESFGLLK